MRACWKSKARVACVRANTTTLPLTTPSYSNAPTTTPTTSQTTSPTTSQEEWIRMTGPPLLGARAVSCAASEGERRGREELKEREREGEKKIEEACLPAYLCT